MADSCPILILEFNRRVGVVRDKCVSTQVGAPAVTNRFACEPDRGLNRALVPRMSCCWHDPTSHLCRRRGLS
jgi:hypothetical protein